MSGVDVADRLVAWARQRFGGPVHLVEPPTTNEDGFDSDIHFVHLAGDALPAEWREPLVLRVKPRREGAAIARYEADVQDWLGRRGFPAPRVLAVLDPGVLDGRPAQVMTRAPGTMALDELRGAPWRGRRLLRQLAGLQARLHALDVHGFPPGDDLLDKRLRLTRAMADTLDHAGLREGLRRVDRTAAELRDAPDAVCHGDFHPLNVLVAGEVATVIDWTDAGIGDRHGDVARTLVLFEVAWIIASGPAERAALRVLGPRLARIHRRAYQQQAPLDLRRVALWTPVHLLHGWSQALGAHAGAFDGDPDQRVPLALVDALERRFDRTMAAIS